MSRVRPENKGSMSQPNPIYALIEQERVYASLERALRLRNPLRLSEYGRVIKPDYELYSEFSSRFSWKVFTTTVEESVPINYPYSRETSYTKEIPVGTYTLFLFPPQFYAMVYHSYELHDSDDMLRTVDYANILNYPLPIYYGALFHGKTYIGYMWVIEIRGKSRNGASSIDAYAVVNFNPVHLHMYANTFFNKLFGYKHAHRIYVLDIGFYIYKYWKTVSYLITDMDKEKASSIVDALTNIPQRFYWCSNCKILVDITQTSGSNIPRCPICGGAL